MLILDDKLTEFDGEHIKPLHARLHQLRFSDANKLSLCVFSSTTTGSGLPEVLISPVAYRFWGDLWRISITVHDRPGVLKRILGCLASHMIDLLAIETASMEQQRLHSIELLVSARKYSTEHRDGTPKNRCKGSPDALPDLRDALLAYLVESVAFRPSGDPRVAIHKVRNLFDAYDAAVHNGNPDPLLAEATVIGGQILLPDTVRHLLRAPSGASPTSYLRVSDSKDRILRAYFFAKDQDASFLGLTFTDRIGALAAVAGAIAHCGLNVIASASPFTLQALRQRCTFVVQSRKADQSVSSAIDRLEATFSTPEFAELVVHIDGRKEPEPARRSLMIFPEQPDTKVADRERLSAITSELGSTRARLETQAVQNAVTREQRADTARRTELLDKLTRHYLPKKQLFLSCSHSRASQRRPAVEKLFEKFEIIVGPNRRTPELRKGVIDNISCCGFFLGIWEDDNELGGLSPWMPFELGVAEARGLRIVLLISDSLRRADHLRIVPERTPLTFGASNFDVVLECAKDLVNQWSSEDP